MTEASKNSPPRRKPVVMKTPAKAKARPAAQTKPKAKPKTKEPQAPLVSKSTPTRTDSGILRALMTAVFIAIAVGGAFALWPKLSSYLAVKNDPLKPANASGDQKAPKQPFNEMEQNRTQVSQQIGNIMERVDDLDQSLQSVMKMVEATTPSKEAEEASAALKQIKERFDKMEERGTELADILERIATLEKTGIAAKDAPSPEELVAKNDQVASAVAKIKKRVVALEIAKATSLDATAGGRALVLAVSQLRDSLHDDSPFDETLQALKALGEGEEQVVKAVTNLEPYAKAGVASLASLRNRFNSVASRVSSAANAPENATWVQTTLYRLTSLISVRKVDGSADEKSVDGILFSAETSLNSGDLMSAVKTLESLEGAAAVPASDWLKDARARLVVEQAMASLHVFAVSILAPKE